MNNIQISSPQAPVPIPLAINDAAALTESGTWSETQVIESIKDSTFRHKCPDRALNGLATVRLGNSIVHTGPMVGNLVLSKPRKRTRIKRFIAYLSS